MRQLQRRGPDSTIPTSSMADIAFLLIIFFMVTSVFASTRGLRIDLPEEAPAETALEPVPAISIRIGASGTTVDCVPVESEALLAEVRARLARDPSRPVMLYTEPLVQYRRMVEVYDRLVDGVGALHLLTEADRRAYRETFGVDPWQSACADRLP